MPDLHPLSPVIPHIITADSRDQVRPQVFERYGKVARVEYRQSRSAVFRQLRIDETTLLRIYSGTKTLRDSEGVETHAGQGHFVLLRRAENLTVGNQVAEAGPYHAEGLVFPEDLLTGFLKSHGKASTYSPVRSGLMTAEFEDGFSRAVTSLACPDLPADILKHRLFELLIWLTEAGVTLWVKQPQALIDRLRDLFAKDIERDWKAGDAGRALGMSEATLRRRLNSEGTSFSTQLKEARLAFALMRIQTTSHPLSEIAYESGFSSQARLSEAFKSRFGLSPSHIRP